MKSKAMKLGIETGSIINHIASESFGVPNVETGATQFHWSDREAYFVNSVSKDLKSCVIERAKAIRIDDYGMSDHQEYRYEREDEENKFIYNLKFRYGRWYVDYGKNGVYGRYGKIDIRFGSMDKYHDFSF